jgi:hypothetical protein
MGSMLAVWLREDDFQAGVGFQFGWRGYYGKTFQGWTGL